MADERVVTDPVEAERSEHPDSFDPGPETGYLRRGHRDHDLDLDSGAQPFDPGEDHYDDKRARRAAKKRSSAERKKLKPSERLALEGLNLKPTGTASPEAPAPRLSRAPERPAHVSLKVPTAKVGAALLLIAAVAGLAGSLLGLPVPGLGESEDAASEPGVDPRALALLDSGTPVGLSKGPYHPVVGEIGYGEQLAKFGAPRSGRMHEGQDVFAKPGTPLVSVRDGVVVDESPENGQYSGGRGNYVVIYSPLDGRSYVYLHLLKRALVRKGDRVDAGQPLGQVGCTGSCDGPHLHFEVRNGRQTLTAETKAVDPLPLLREWPQVPLPEANESQDQQQKPK